MNVLMLTSDFYPAWGGIGTYVSELVHNLPDDLTMHVLTPKRLQLGKTKFNGTEAHEGLPKNVHVHHISAARDTFRHYLYFQLACRRHVPALIKEHNIDIIHSHNTMPDLFLSPRRLRTPVVTTIHTTLEGQAEAVRSCTGSNVLSLEDSERMTLLLGRGLTLLENHYYKGERSFITVSEWAKTEIAKEKHINPDKIRVIHNGITADRFASTTRQEAEQRLLASSLADSDEPRVLYFSRLIDKKGLTFLTDAIPRILEKCDAHFIFAGAGRKVELDLPREHYTYLGYVQEREKPYLYALADIFVLPSLYENCPISILEAMASRKAIVTTSVGGIPELIQHEENGLIIPPRSPEAITRAVVRLIEDKPLRERLGRNAARRAQTTFTSKRTADQTVQYYYEVLAEHATTRSSRKLKTNHAATAP